MRILCITTVKDEGPYLLEWIAHYRAAGITDFLIFSNDCSDGTHEILKTLQMAGIVRHISQKSEDRRSVQWQALKAAWKHPLYKKADWVLVCDIDEFINVKVGNHTIQDLIANTSENADAIVMQWRLFGHNDVFELKDLPVTEQFTRAAPTDMQFPIATSLCKTLFKTSGPFKMLGVHRPKQKELSKARRPIMVDGSGRFLPEPFATNNDRISLFGQPPGHNLVQMNHYAVRSAAAFILKSARGLPNRRKEIDLQYWVDRNFNTEEDTSIAAMRPATQAALDKLRGLPGLTKLHNETFAWHSNRFSTLIKDPEFQSLMTKICVAGSSSVLPLDMQRKLLDWYHGARIGAREESA